MSSIRWILLNKMFFSLFGVFLLFQCFCSQAADGDGNRARCGFTITVKPQPTFNPLQVSVGCFTLTVYQPSIRYKGVFVDILDGCYTHNLTLILSDQVLRVGRLSLNKLHIPGRRRRPHTTGVQDNAVLSSQKILNARSSRSFLPASLFCRHKRF